MVASDLERLRRAIELARTARSRGNLPFGALLVDEHGAILVEAGNTAITTRDCTGHAETNLLREAGRRLSFGVIARSTLYASAEPCAMCAGAIYWSGVRRLVYALSSGRVYALLGEAADCLAVSCRDVLGRGQRTIEVEGPAIEGEAGKVFEGLGAGR
jgi:tRNA(Arg) A34 adenosine deaminase TadA